jgi:activator of HSP90 ATPase
VPWTQISRRRLVLHMAALPVGFGMAARALSASNNPAGAKPLAADGLTYASAAIHQEVAFKASPRRIYEALTTSKQFDAVTRLSDAIALVTAKGAKPTSISPEVGGSFTLFGGYITGRNLQMLPGERLVQAWHAGSWGASDYSIVRFVLTGNDTETKLVFDQRGFPDGEGESLADGWHTHYWEPLAKFLRTGTSG